MAGHELISEHVSNTRSRRMCCRRGSENPKYCGPEIRVPLLNLPDDLMHTWSPLLLIQEEPSRMTLQYLCPWLRRTVAFVILPTILCPYLFNMATKVRPLSLAWRRASFPLTTKCGRPFFSLISIIQFFPNTSFSARKPTGYG